MPHISLRQLEELTEQRVPFARPYRFDVTRLGEGEAWVRLPANDGLLRPGGTIAGPAMMALADYAMYAAVLTAIGPVELAVTTSLNINFLRKPQPGDLFAKASLLKLGKRLAVGAVDVTGTDRRLVAHVTCTYSVPPERDADRASSV